MLLGNAAFRPCLSLSPLPPAAWSQVSNRTSQFGVGNAIMAHDRHLLVDLTHPLYPFEITVVTARPRPLSQSFNILRPFSLPVWMAACGSLVATIAVAFLTLRGASEGRGRHDLMWYSARDAFGMNLGQGL